jgi:DNA-binding transcriptional MerR regulator
VTAGASGRRTRSSSARQPPQSTGLTIGTVLSQLQDEFPDLTMSKVRFLDARGLVSPERSASGYRRYAERDVDRLRFVLRCQRDKYWPLRVIADALDAYDRGLQPGDEDDGPRPPARATDPALTEVAEPAVREDNSVQLTRAELQRATGLDTRALVDLESFGLIRADRDKHYSGHDLQVAHAAATLLSYGLEARHLRPFRLAAEREAALVRGLGGMSQGDDLEEHIRECLELHLALVRADLAQG